MSTSFGGLEARAPAAPATALRLGRHAFAMALAALANPMLYFDGQPLLLWAATWAVPVIVAAAVSGVYLLFFTARARATWQRAAIWTAWVLLALVLAGYWVTFSEARRAGAATPPIPSATTQPAAEEWWKKGATPVN